MGIIIATPTGLFKAINEITEMEHLAPGVSCCTIPRNATHKWRCTMRQSSLTQHPPRRKRSNATTISIRYRCVTVPTIRVKSQRRSCSSVKAQLRGSKELPLATYSDLACHGVLVLRTNFGACLTFLSRCKLLEGRP